MYFSLTHWEATQCERSAALQDSCDHLKFQNVCLHQSQQVIQFFISTYDLKTSIPMTFIPIYNTYKTCNMQVHKNDWVVMKRIALALENTFSPYSLY